VLKKTSRKPTFEQTLATLSEYGFDVSAPASVANVANAVRVARHGCAAYIVPGTSGREDAGPVIAVKPGVVIGGEIGHILDRGFQKFVKTQHAERPATAEYLRALHRFTEELRQAIGGTSLYNESIGTVSDSYLYDRVKGRNLPEAERPVPAWEQPVGAATPGEVS
jgi:hypothetical protein